MAEILIAARTDFPQNAGTGNAWRWALGHVVAVQSDGFEWGNLEHPSNFATPDERRFALLKFPSVSVARLQRYLDPHLDVDGKTVLRGRLWQIQWSTLPTAAKNILKSTGILTIGSPAQGGDFTWAQVQNFILRLDTNAADTDPLS